MRIPLFPWLFLMPFYFVSLNVHIFVVYGQCPGDQQSLLLQLKNSLKFNSTSSKKLSTWNGTDYCSWVGVSCKDGCVSHLDLSSESVSGGLDNSSALFSLQSMEDLNLAYNNFQYIQIPPAFNKLAGLRILNLSNSGFSGQVPIEISSLTRLLVLDLSGDIYLSGTTLKLENPNLSLLIRNLSKLTELHLDGVNISAQGTEWCQAISSSLPNLKVLSLSTCNLSGPIDSSFQKLHSLSVIRLENNNLSAQVPGFFSNFTNLTFLRFSNCQLDGTFPKKIFRLPTLQNIDLSTNPKLQGSLPDFSKYGSLRSLVLNGANFSGQLLPNSIGNLKMLSKLDIATCNFTGSIPRSMENLTQLVYLDLSWNKFNGSVPFFSKAAKNLTLINLSYNQLTGQINSSHWESLTNLVNLDMRHNLLNGTVPPALLSLPMLQKLLLSSNQFSGELLEFAHISVLDTLDLSSNNLKGPIPRSIFNLRELKILSLSSNNFSGSFPLNNLQKLKNLSSLDLSYNSLLLDYNSNTSYSSFPHLTTLKLASGKLGRFPEFLRYQSKLSILDLSQNQIPGEIPNWIWKIGNLVQLNLSCNSLVTLEGPFHNLTSTLSILDLHSNQLQGPIPIFPQFATYLDYSQNNFSSIIQTDMGSFLSYTIFFSLSSNNFLGAIPESVCIAPYLQVLDLSNNSLSGTIPHCLTTISTLAVLNLRRNKLTGDAPDNFTHCSLKTLDLSENHISGQFPKSLATCTMLEVLNLGNNQIEDIFPCFLKKISTLRVLVLRSNKFYDHIGCPHTTQNWPNLQIVDIAHNNFSGGVPGKYLRTWKAMMADEDDLMSKHNHLRFQVLKFSQVYYHDAITVTNKGLEMELVKILSVFTYIDISSNKFSGPIPEAVGELKSLYGLNLSRNFLTGTIPSSLGNLRQLESLDLSSNSLSGPIPAEFAKLNFLSFLNLSGNQLVGKIPTGTQIQSFSEASFAGNPGLCGPPTSRNCNTSISPDATHNESNIGFDWQSIYTGVGFGVGAGVIVILLIAWEEGRNWLDESIDKILLVIIPIMGYTYKTRDKWDDGEEEGSEENSTFFIEDYEEDENESGERVFRGSYCVFCSKLDMSRKRAIHEPNCTCRFSPPISSTSSSSYSFSP